MKNQIVTVKRTKSGTPEAGSDIFSLCETYGQLQEALNAAIGGLKANLQNYKRLGWGKSALAKSTSYLVESCEETLDASKKLLPTVPIIPVGDEKTKAEWSVSFKTYLNGILKSGVIGSEDSLEGAILKAKTVYERCKVPPDDAKWKVLEARFDEKTGHGFIRIKCLDAGIQARIDVLKDGKPYTGE